MIAMKKPSPACHELGVGEPTIFVSVILLKHLPLCCHQIRHFFWSFFCLCICWLCICFIYICCICICYICVCCLCICCLCFLCLCHCQLWCHVKQFCPYIKSIFQLKHCQGPTVIAFGATSVSDGIISVTF